MNSTEDMILDGRIIHKPILSERIFSKQTDGYKPPHALFYDKGVKWMYDYMESRGGTFQNITPFGSQAMCMKEFTGPKITVKQNERARKFYKSYFGMDGVYNYEGFDFIARRLGGVMPMEFSAIPEGMSVPVRTPILTYRNTHKVMEVIEASNRIAIENFGHNVSFLPGFIEPKVFHIWSPTTVCTYSQHCKKVIYEFLVKTGTPENIAWMLWCFGYRGVSSNETAESAGAGHLVNSRGSDTIPAIDFVNEYYSDGDFDEDGDPTYMPADGVRATEHSVMTFKGRQGEPIMVGRILDMCPTGVVAMVADSYDLWHFAGYTIGTQFRDRIIERDGVVVIRPDSGDPIPTMLKLLWILGEKFGTTINAKGYKVLGVGKGIGKIKTLQGEKNTYEAIYNMCRALEAAGWSLDNIACFGIGGALLQAHTRDEQNMAVKLSAYEDAEGNEIEVYKDPITDPNKYSKRGRFHVTTEQNPVTGLHKIVTRQLAAHEPEPDDNMLRVINRNGAMIVHDRFELVRDRADAWMKAA